MSAVSKLPSTVSSGKPCAVKYGRSILFGTMENIPYVHTKYGEDEWYGHFEFFMEGGPVVELPISQDGPLGWELITASS